MTLRLKVDGIRRPSNYLDGFFAELVDDATAIVYDGDKALFGISVYEDVIYVGNWPDGETWNELAEIRRPEEVGDDPAL